jgi:tRNA/tmRNA/rRNA uracil-C5-methylase (TrmA/RlmC/RlmD family)
MGRKVASASNIGRAATAARGMSKIGKESQDVARAAEEASAARTQLGDLEAQMEADIQQVTADWDLSQEPFERVLVKPKRGGVSVQLVSLVWVPA